MNLNALDVPGISRGAWEADTLSPYAEIGRVSADLQREEEALSKLSREMAGHISRGEQDLAQLKSVLIQQKQLQIQTMHREVGRLQHPERNGSAQTASDTSSLRSFRESIPQLSEQPAATEHWSAYAQNLLSRMP